MHPGWEFRVFRDQSPVEWINVRLKKAASSWTFQPRVESQTCWDLQFLRSTEGEKAANKVSKGKNEESNKSKVKVTKLMKQ